MMMLMVENTPKEKIAETFFEISSAPPPDWDFFVYENSAGILFSQTWIRVVAHGYKAAELYACIRKNGRIETAMAGIIYNFIFFKMFFSNVPYGGILGDLSLAPILIEKVESELRKRKIHQVRMTQTADHPYTALPAYTEKKAFQHSLDLNGVTSESLWKRYKKNIRRDILRAQRSGLTVRKMSDSRELEDYYSLYRLTMRRNAALCHYTKKLYHEIDVALIQTGKAEILFADYNGKPAAGMLLVFSSDRTYLIGNVSDPKLLKLCPNDLLYHAALEETLKRNLTCFDFMTSEYADESLMKFKEKWGAKRRPFGIYQKNLSPFHCRLWEIVWAFAASYGRIFLNRAGF